MDSLFREAVVSCLRRLQDREGGASPNAGPDRAALAEELPRLVKHISMLPGPDRLTFMPICGGIRRWVVEGDPAYLADTAGELSALLAAIDKGAYRNVRETPEAMLWAGMQNGLIHLRNLRYYGGLSHPNFEGEQAALRAEIERYRRYVTVGRLTLPQRQAHEFVLKGLARLATEGDLSRAEETESKLVSMLVEH